MAATAAIPSITGRAHAGRPSGERHSAHRRRFPPPAQSLHPDSTSRSTKAKDTGCSSVTCDVRMAAFYSVYPRPDDDIRPGKLTCARRPDNSVTQLGDAWTNDP